MKCKEVIERLSEYWSNELDERTRGMLAAHLRECSSCQQEWAIFQSAMNALRSVPTPEPSIELLSQIQFAVLAKQPSRHVPVWRWQWAMAIGAVAIIIALVSVPFFNRVREKSESSSPYLVLAEKPSPSSPFPALEQPLQSPSTASTPFKPQPLPSEQIAKPRRLTTAERYEVKTTKQERRQEQLKSKKMFPSSAIAELPSIEVPSGERIPEQFRKSAPTEIAPPSEQTAPKLAELPVEPRAVPFKLEAKLSERVQVPEMQESERARAPRASAVQQGPTTAVPAISATKKVEVEVETQSPVLMGQHGFPTASQQPMQQYTGKLGQGFLSNPFTLRWSKFEPVVVGKVTLWQLAISSESPQIVAVFLQPSEKVEILNALQTVTSEGKGLVIWRDKIHFGKEVTIPILIRTNEAGTRRLLVTLETMDGKTFSWWCVFPAVMQEVRPKIRHQVVLQIEQWTILDLLTHFAWENKVAFLIPEEVGNRTINVPTKTVSLWEIFALLEQQTGGRWHRFGNTFSLICPTSPTSTVKQ